jgi:tetratricopeptide (TPR) repeat protein
MGNEDEIIEDQELEGVNSPVDPADAEIIAKLKKYGVYILLASVAVVALVIYGNNKTESDSEELNEAGIALERVMAYFEKGDFEKALQGDVTVIIDGKPLMGLRAIASKYSGSEPAYLAAFYAGKIELGSGKLNEARSLFESAKSSESELIRLGAVSMLGAVEESEDDYSGAASYYEKAFGLAAQKDIKTRMKLFAATCFEKAGSEEKAKKAYNKVISMNYDNAYSEYVGLARQGLVRIGTKID